MYCLMFTFTSKDPESLAYFIFEAKNCLMVYLMPSYSTFLISFAAGFKNNIFPSRSTLKIGLGFSMGN